MLSLILTLIGFGFTLFLCVLTAQICWALLKWIIKLVYRFVQWWPHRND